MTQIFLVNLLGLVAALGACLLAVKLWKRARMADIGALEADASAEVGTTFWRRLVSPLARGLRPSDAEELEELQTQLLQAARRNRDAVDRYLEERVAFLLVGVTFAMFMLFSVQGGGGFLLTMIGILVGWAGPSWAVRRRARERREAIEQSLPAGLDLLMTCMRAGLSLEKALVQVANNVESAYPVFAEEIHLTAREADAGVPLADALRRLGKRVGLDELSSTCSVMAQAHVLGAPIGDTLEEHAESSRRARMAGLEERAGKAAATLTLPLALFFLPAGLAVILGPAIIILSRVMG